MSYGETLSRCDTTAFVTALALVADAKRQPVAAVGHMPFPGHRTCAEWQPNRGGRS